MASRYLSRLFDVKESFGGVLEASEVLARSASQRMTIFGEVHATEPVIALQKTVAAAMADALVGEGRLNIVMEHFSFEMQHLLDDYSSSRIDLQQLEEAYA